MMDRPPYEHDPLTHAIIGAALDVHTRLGPGHFEKDYENALCLGLARQGILYEQQKRFPVYYIGERVGDMVADLVVEDQVIVELKAVKDLLPVHEAQVIAYLKAAELKRGLLFNFNVKSLRKGMRRLSV